MQVLSAMKHPSVEVQNELQDIRAAVKGLLHIKTERLKWPGIDSDAPQSDSAN
jgi:CheY-like chemotaxis protein